MSLLLGIIIGILEEYVDLPDLTSQHLTLLLDLLNLHNNPDSSDLLDLPDLLDFLELIFNNMLSILYYCYSHLPSYLKDSDRL